MTRNWGRLGAAVQAAYLSLGYTQQDFADMAGVSRATINRLESDSGREPSRKTLYGVERALGWPVGTAIEVAEGAEPPAATATAEVLTIPRPAALDEPGMLERLPEQIRQELESGELIGVDVIDLGPTDSGTKMLMIVKRDLDAPPLSPEEKRELLAEWQARRRLLWQQSANESSAQ